jgi:hypothetical protein
VTKFHPVFFFFSPFFCPWQLESVSLNNEMYAIREEDPIPLEEATESFSRPILSGHAERVIVEKQEEQEDGTENKAEKEAAVGGSVVILQPVSVRVKKSEDDEEDQQNENQSTEQHQKKQKTKKELILSPVRRSARQRQHGQSLSIKPQTKQEISTLLQQTNYAYSPNPHLLTYTQASATSAGSTAAPSSDSSVSDAPKIVFGYKFQQQQEKKQEQQTNKEQQEDDDDDGFQIVDRFASSSSSSSTLDEKHTSDIKTASEKPVSNYVGPQPRVSTPMPSAKAVSVFASSAISASSSVVEQSSSASSSKKADFVFAVPEVPARFRNKQKVWIYSPFRGCFLYCSYFHFFSLSETTRTTTTSKRRSHRC